MNNTTPHQLDLLAAMPQGFTAGASVTVLTWGAIEGVIESVEGDIAIVRMAYGRGVVTRKFARSSLGIE